MAKYTTEVRTICEVKAGLEESEGFSSVDQVIRQSWNSIFTTTAQTWDESYKPVICQKILKHYYVREIGMETVGLWMLAMNTRFEELLPKYNQLWSVQAQGFNPLYDADVTETGNKAFEGKEGSTTSGNRTNTRTDDLQTRRDDALSDTRTDNTTQTTTNDLTQITANNLTDTTNRTDNNSHLDAYQDTPQGALSGVGDLDYLTNVRRVTEDNTGDVTVKSTGDVQTDNTGSQTVENTGDVTTDHDGYQTHKYTGTQVNQENFGDEKNANVNNTEDYVNKVLGKRNGESYGETFAKFVQNLKNIDMMFIDEFQDCFMGIW